MIPLPSKLHAVQEGAESAVFEVEGLYPGYGHTIGNSLRRMLLSSLEGAVITSVKIEGVGHEFSTIEGVHEDIVDLMLNLKQVRFRLHEPGPHLITLSAKGEKEITAAAFQTPSQVEVVTKDLHIATLTAKKSSLNIDATVESGLGYVPVENRSKDKVAVGTIALDAAFSPVRHVNYEVENMRVGDRTDYNRLRIAIETDGSMTPREALTRAVEILVAQCAALHELAAAGGSGHLRSSSEEEGADESGSAEESDADRIAKIKLEDLKISSRTMNALREAGIKTVGGLMRKREASLSEIEGIGEKGIQEIKKALASVGGSLK